MTKLDFRILGPLEVLDRDRGRVVVLGGPKPRALLVVLLLHRRQVVSTDRLIDALWGAHPPATATKTLQAYVSRLRDAIGADALLTRGRGYVLEVDSEQVDADRFDEAVAEGRAALERGDAGRAAELLRGALALWRGPALADFAYEPFAQTEAARLDVERLNALEDRVDADLAAGRHGAVIAELEALTRDHPLRERFQAQQILALYRSGRQADALERHREATRRLRDELGLEPGRALQELQRAILVQARELDAPPRAGAARVSRGGTLLVGGGLLLLAAVAAAVVVGAGMGGRSVSAAANSVAVLDLRTGSLLADVPVGARPGDVVFGAGSIWVANRDDETISQIDPVSRRVRSTTAPGGSIDGLAIDSVGLWASDVNRGRVVGINPAFHSVARIVRIAAVASLGGGRAAGPVAAGDGSVWVGNGDASIVRLDARTHRVVSRTDVGNDPAAIAVGDGAVWIADDQDATVTRLDPATNAVADSTPVGDGPSAIAVGDGAVWVADTQADEVQRIDPATTTLTATIAVGRRPTGVAVSAGAVWVANSLSGTVSRIDPRTNRVVATIALGQQPQGLTVARGNLWVSVDGAPAAGGAAAGGKGGALRIAVTGDSGGGDPAQLLDSERAYATCALLQNYPDRPYPQGFLLRPEVAAARPAISNLGRTYTFTIRPGFRFSPPSNQPVTAAAFRRAIVRVLDPRSHSFGASLIGDVVGAPAFAAGRTRRLAGVVSDGDRLLIRLRHAAPDLLARLATTWFCAVPPDTPITASTVPLIPSAGPYYTASYVPGRALVLRRNPNYHGPRPHRIAEIDYDIGVSSRRALADVTEDRADYFSNANILQNEIPPPTAARLNARYGAASTAARAGRQRFFVRSSLATYSLIFNTRQPPFDDVRLRRAVNYALDRRALAPTPFPSATGVPAAQFVPPGMPGYRQADVYPLGGPDLAKAKRLAGAAKRRAVLYTCNTTPCAQSARIVHDNLATIGIHVEIHQLPIDRMFDADTAPDPPFDLALWNWFVDYPDASDFIQTQLAAAHLSVGPALARRIRAAALLTGSRRYDAYAGIDHDLAAQVAPAAPYASGTVERFFSARVGCQTFQPLYGLDLGALCLRP